MVFSSFIFLRKKVDGQELYCFEVSSSYRVECKILQDSEKKSPKHTTPDSSQIEKVKIITGITSPWLSPRYFFGQRKPVVKSFIRNFVTFVLSPDLPGTVPT